MMPQDIDEVLEKIKKVGYEYYYYPSYEDLFEKALENEKNYRLNCRDGIKDLSLEATNRRIINDIKRMRKGEK